MTVCYQIYWLISESYILHQSTLFESLRNMVSKFLFVVSIFSLVLSTSCVICNIAFKYKCAMSEMTFCSVTLPITKRTKKKNETEKS